MTNKLGIARMPNAELKSMIESIAQRENHGLELDDEISSSVPDQITAIPAVSQLVFSYHS